MILVDEIGLLFDHPGKFTYWTWYVGTEYGYWSAERADALEELYEVLERAGLRWLTPGADKPLEAYLEEIDRAEALTHEWGVLLETDTRRRDLECVDCSIDTCPAFRQDGVSSPPAGVMPPARPPRRKSGEPRLLS